MQDSQKNYLTFFQMLPYDTDGEIAILYQQANTPEVCNAETQRTNLVQAVFRAGLNCLRH